MYGEVMQTITVRVTPAEKARIDELAKRMAEAESSGTGWWTPKRGRGDVLRLAMLLLEQRVTADVDDTPAMRAERGLYRGRNGATIDERVTALQKALAPPAKRTKKATAK